MNMTAAQKAALVAFLKTLTDTGVATAEKWSNPFK
jgi:cytochrome c peroxidase